MEIEKNLMDAEGAKRQALTVISEQLSIIAEAGYETEILRNAMWKFTKAFAASYFAEKLMTSQRSMMSELQSTGISELDAALTDVYVVDAPYKRKRIILRPQNWPFTVLIDCPGGIYETGGQDAESLVAVVDGKVAQGTSSGKFLILDWNAREATGEFPEMAGKFEQRKISEI